MPRQTTRQPRKDSVRNREQIIDAAIALVRSDGESVPMLRIAEHAGLGVGTIYRHFPTREALYAELVFRSFGIAADNAAEAAAHAGTAPNGVKHFLLATVRDRDRFVMPLHGGPAVFTPLTRQRQADVRSSLRQLIERGQAQGELRPDLTAEDLILTGALLSRQLPGTSDWERLAARQIALFVEGVKARSN